MTSILDSFKGLITDEVVSGVAGALGEDKGGVAKAASAALPSVLGGLLNSNTGNHNLLSGLMGQAANNNGLLGDLLGGLTDSGSAGGGLMSSIINGIFGDKLGGIVNIISNVSGLGSKSSNGILGLVGSLVASFLGKKMLSEGLNLGGILDWLKGGKSEIVSAAPAGIMDLLSSSGASSETTHTTSGYTSSSTGSDQDDNKGGMKWLLPLLLLALLAAAIWYFTKGCNKDNAVTHAVENVGDAVSDGANAVGDAVADGANAVANTVKGALNEAGDWVVEKGEAVAHKLDNGIEINTTKGSCEDRLLAFIKDPNAVPDKNVPVNWFNFEDLLFETGSAKLKPGSEMQLKNTVEILKAYPGVQVKLGGYTDNTGNPEANIKLSDARAKTVYERMIAEGAPKESFQADKPYEGYGQEHPVCPANDTPECQAQNRRIAIVVTKK